jgi:excisionase family DNA binding protein
VSARRNDGPWLSVSGAARALGVSPSTLRLWASEGRIPHVRTAGGP